MTPERARAIANELGLDAESVGAVHIESAQTVAASKLRGYTGLGAELAERAALIDALVVNESWFFRDGIPFRSLVDRFAKYSGRVRVLSAPCARGEEAWSAAMALASAGRAPSSFEVVGLDVSGAAIEAARTGVYQPMAFRGEFAAAAKPWLEPTDRGSRVIDALRSSVRFQEVNLTTPLPWPSIVGDFDVILCRNLLIYLTSEARSQLIRSLRRLLAPGGIVIAGHAEGHAFVQAGMGRAEGGAGMVFEELDASRSAEPPPTLPNVRRERAPTTLQVASGAASSVLAAAALHSDTTPPVVRESLLDRARWLADAGLYEDASEALADHLAEYPADIDAVELRGVVYMAQNRYADAAAAFQRALELTPARPDLLDTLARIADLRGRTEMANTYRLRAVAIRSGAQ